MIIKLNDWAESEDIEIIEFLEPQGAVYQLKQGNNVINFVNEHQVKELLRAFKFIIDDNTL